MDKITIENEAMEIVGQQVADGNYSGMFDLQVDDDKYVTVYWNVNIDIVDND